MLSQKRSPVSMLLPVIAVAILALVNGQAQSCCISDYLDPEILAENLASSGAMDGVEIVVNTCEELRIQGLMIVITVVYIYKIIDDDDLEVTMITLLGDEEISTNTDTTKNVCGSAVSHGPSLFSKTVKPVTCFPNPFRDKVQVDFSNPSYNAGIEIYDSRGVKVYETKRVKNTNFTWKPEGLNPGVYLIRITTPGQIRSQRVTYLR